MQKIIILFSFLSICVTPGTVAAQQYMLSSPDGHLQLKINNGKSLSFSLIKDNDVIIPSSTMAMVLNNGSIPRENDKVSKVVRHSVNEIIHPVVPVKNAIIKNNYNELTLEFQDHFNVIFRAYNDAIAYRFQTGFPGSIIVKNERFDIMLPQDAEAWPAFITGKDNVQDKWMNPYEHIYQKMSVSDIPGNKIAQLPLLIDLHHQGKVLITESDLYDYPGLYFEGTHSNGLQSVFPPRVKSDENNIRDEGGWDRILRPASVYNDIADTKGSRAFPWRIIAVADKDDQLLDNEIVYKLGEPDKIKDGSWIKPGLVAWDWWNDWNITGVNFKAGINTDTYKYYINFAGRNHIPYIIMDEGWYQLGDLTKVNPEINMQELIQYARQRNVAIILWCSWLTLDHQMKDALDLFQQWGIKGIKVDFMNRDDQAMVNFYWKCAEAAAQHHLLVDFHGAHKPAGLNRTYPNVVNFEGVPGLEQDKWIDSLATPVMAATLPYIRMFAGPMDYTPGAMRNAQKKDFRAINDNPMSLGTRCQQLAMYVVFDAPLQMLSDNPVAYEKNKECLDFIVNVPTTWDQTIPLAGEVGQYAALARRKGDQYFVGVINNWQPRDLTLDFSFLPKGTHHIVIFQDGVNADRNGIDYMKVVRNITQNDKLTIHLAPGGGWAARIK
jgi:alpha-glucosidase